jgi:hypothetical protein
MQTKIHKLKKIVYCPPNPNIILAKFAEKTTPNTKYTLKVLNT